MPAFDTPTPIATAIELGIAHIRLVAGDATRTVVQVSPSDPAKDRDVRAAELTQVAFDGGRLRVEQPKRHGLGGIREGSVDVAITLPAGSSLQAAVGVGDLRAEGRLGDCRVTAGTGAITLAEVAALHVTCGLGDVVVDRASGRAEVTTGSGNLRLAALDGRSVLKTANGDTWVGVARDELRLQSANGRITIDEALGDVQAKTARGDVRLGAIAGGSVDLESHLGDIDVGVREGSAAWLDVKSAMGKVSIELDAADAPDPSAEAVAVRARTTLGKIRIRRP